MEVESFGEISKDVPIKRKRVVEEKQKLLISFRENSHLRLMRANPLMVLHGDSNH